MRWLSTMYMDVVECTIPFPLARTLPILGQRPRVVIFASAEAIYVLLAVV
jgi:hypothetical protein